MASRLGKHAILIVAASTALALRHQRPRRHAKQPRAPQQNGQGPYRQRLRNIRDTQYSTSIEVGGQVMQGIVDTGSAELLVFGAGCEACGVTGVYSPQNSSTFKRGRRRKDHRFGNGICTAGDGREKIAIGPLEAARQPFWAATSCHMPMLAGASFNAVIGLGAPGSTADAARRGLEKIAAMDGKAKRSGHSIPRRFQRLKREYEADLSSSWQPALLDSLRISRFSVCLEKGPGSPGWLVWNDAQPKEPSPFTRFSTLGKRSWTIRLGTVSLRGGSGNSSVTVGCRRGCDAVLDTGTSLIAVPHHVYTSVYDTVMGLGVGCGDLGRLPDLVLEAGGHKLRLPPDSYMGDFAGKTPGGAENPAQPGRQPSGAHRSCQFLLMDLGGEQAGRSPLVVLGMPFFREYYTSFELGSGPGSRSVSVAPANGNCQPESKGPALGGAGGPHVSLL